MTPRQQETMELLKEMDREEAQHRAEGIAYFDGSPTWDKFCKRMGDEALRRIDEMAAAKDKQA
ncbi:hypothetical protein ACIPL1_24740 [Pseudomonas sp. NPDC090202]|uniref:hypothetical protein n=1 Tax=Pseudomonas sp. NPDC090202 TaxID=3364476 RepID=UPI00380D6D66